MPSGHGRSQQPQHATPAGLAAAAAAACDGAIALLHAAPSVNDPLAQEAFRLVAAFLRTCPSFQPSQKQVGPRGGAALNNILMR